MVAKLTLGKLYNGVSNVETMWQKGAVGAGIAGYTKLKVELGLAAQTVIIPPLGKTKEGRFSFQDCRGLCSEFQVNPGYSVKLCLEK